MECTAMSAAAVEQRGFEFLHEQALAAHLGQRPVEDLVAARGHAQQLHFAGRIEGFETGLDVLGLPQGEAAFTGGNDDAVGRRCAHGIRARLAERMIGLTRRYGQARANRGNLHACAVQHQGRHLWRPFGSGF
jgi:hypothetical protein